MSISAGQIAHLARINLRYLVFHGIEWINDRRYGINTRTSFRGVQYLDGLTLVGDKAGANPYAVTPYGTLDRFLKQIPADVSQYTFIDYGSGKGRVLLMAARHPFREVIGIELAEELHRIAEQNIANFNGERRSPVRSLLRDATTFQLPPGPCILFFSNPFGHAVMKQVVDNIVSSYLRAPRHIIVGYYNPTVSSFEGGKYFRDTQTITEDRLSSLAHTRPYKVRIFEVS